MYVYIFCDNNLYHHVKWLDGKDFGFKLKRWMFKPHFEHVVVVISSSWPIEVHQTWIFFQYWIHGLWVKCDYGCKWDNMSCIHLLLGLFLEEYFLEYF
jgi:hypothetical protein